MLSDDDKDIDIESDEDEEIISRQRSLDNIQCYSQAEKRAHHNALERKRRDHIKDSFSSLRDTVIALQGGKVASRVQILKEAAEYINMMRKNTREQQRSIDSLKRQNIILDSQIQILEKAIATGNITHESCEFTMTEIVKAVKYNNSDELASSDNESVTGMLIPQPKKLRT